MTVTDGLPNGKQPFPQGYFANPAEQRAWDNFYADARASDGIGLQEHYAAGLARIAAQFAGSPGLLGLEILNEPWPGSSAASCITPAGCPPGGFDQTSLTDFYRRMVPAIRAADPHHLIAYEPNLLFDYGDATGLGSIADNNVMLAFHNYCLAYNVSPGSESSSCATEEQRTMANAEAYQQQTGVGLLMDEWGNTVDTSTIDRVAAEADQHMVGWADWALEDCCNSAAAVVKDGSKPPTADNVNTPVLNALVRAYPRAIAGTPTSFSYDPASATFRLDYQAKLVDGRPASGLQTEIFVPRRHYPAGYRAQVSGASVVSTPTAGILRLCNRPGAGNVSVTVTVATGSSTELPDQTQGSSTCPGGVGGDATSVTAGAPYTVSHGGGRVGVAGLADIVLPQSRRCLSRRQLAIHVLLHRGTRLLRETVTVDGHRAPASVSHHMLTADIRLRGLPRGRYRVHLALRVRRAGRSTTITITRVFHTCQKRHPPFG
jgi:endoglycosylceramidase